MTPLRTSAIILAAGASTRLGHPKQMVMLNGETLLDRTVRMAREAGCRPVLVVLGAAEMEIRVSCELQGATVLSNPEWREGGMGSSLRAGVEALDPGVDAVLVMTCDQPAADANHLRALMEAVPAGRVASAYTGRRGVPAGFPRADFPLLAAVQGDSGARLLLENARAIPLDRGELDIDTSEALTEARQRFGADEGET